MRPVMTVRGIIVVADQGRAALAEPDRLAASLPVRGRAVMAEDAVGQVVVADHRAQVVVGRHEFGHVAHERRAALRGRRPGGRRLPEIPPRRLVPPSPEAGEPAGARAVFDMGGEGFFHSWRSSGPVAPSERRPCPCPRPRSRSSPGRSGRHMTLCRGRPALPFRARDAPASDETGPVRLDRRGRKRNEALRHGWELQAVSRAPSPFDVLPHRHGSFTDCPIAQLQMERHQVVIDDDREEFIRQTDGERRLGDRPDPRRLRRWTKKDDGTLVFSTVPVHPARPGIATRSRRARASSSCPT